MGARAGAGVRWRSCQFFLTLEGTLRAYVQHSAWLDTAPEKPDPKAKSQPKTRREEIGEGQLSELPDVGAGDYLLSILFDVGPVVSNGFGANPISEIELAAWQFNRGVRLTWYECYLLRRMSRDYAAMLSEARNASCPAPYAAEADTAPEAVERRERKISEFFKQRATR